MELKIGGTIKAGSESAGGTKAKTGNNAGKPKDFRRGGPGSKNITAYGVQNLWQPPNG